MAGSVDRDPASVRNCFRKAPRVFLAEDSAVSAAYDEGGATQIGDALAKGTEGGRYDRKSVAVAAQIRFPDQSPVGTGTKIVPEAVAEEPSIAARIKPQCSLDKLLKLIEPGDLLHELAYRQAGFHVYPRSDVDRDEAG